MAELTASSPLGAAPSPQEQVFDRHRNQRTQRILWSIVSSVLTKPVAVIIPIITVPLFLKYLGQERYGLFESIGALTVWLGLTNAGLTLGLINCLTQCHVTGDREAARRYVTSLGLLLIAMTVVVLLLVSIATPFVRWDSVFRTDTDLARSEVPLAVWVSAVLTLIGLVATLPQAVYVGYQETHRNNIWDGVGKLMTLLMCLAIVHTRFGLVGVIMAAAGSMVAVRVINTIVLFAFEKPWLMPRPRYFDRSVIYGMLKQGIGLFLIGTSSLAIFQVDKLIIGHFRSAEEVATYSVIGRPFLLAFGLYSMLLGPLWPAHGEALRRGDVQWVRRALGWSLLLGCVSVLLCGLSMFFFGDQILRIWTRGVMVSVSRPLVVAMTCMFLLWTTMSSISVLLNSIGIVRVQTWFIGLHALLNLLIATTVVRRYGATGVAWSMTIAGLVTSLWGYPWMLNRFVFQRKWQPAPPAAAGGESGAVLP